MGQIVIPTDRLVAQLDAWLSSTASQLGLTIDELAEKYELIESVPDFIQHPDDSFIVRTIYRLRTK